MEKQLSEKLPRVEVVDALRGFAVMAILLVHSLEHFIFPVYPVDQPAWLNILNDGVFNVTFTLLAGKSYAIFALLFGFTFYIQSANQQRKGKDFGYRFLWRLLLLVAFATLNAAFFPAGDVLLLFSVVGIVLFVVRKWSDCAILVTAILFLLQPVEWYHYIVGLFDPSHTLPDWGAWSNCRIASMMSPRSSLILPLKSTASDGKLPFPPLSCKERIRVSGWIQKSHSNTSSSSRVVWISPPKTRPQSSFTILFASSRSSAATV